MSETMVDARPDAGLPTDINRLAAIAADAAILGALDYLRASRTFVDSGVLATKIRLHVQAIWDSAIADARQAIDAHMPDAAGSTFLASMRLAGIRAASDCLPADASIL